MSTFDPQAMAGQVVEAARGFIQRALAPLQEDMRGALQRLDKHAQALESAERRLSRHGEHLARLESRLQRLEHGGDK
jgi:chromosome segregation ATPase